MVAEALSEATGIRGTQYIALPVRSFLRAAEQSVWLATLVLGSAMLMFDFGAVLYGINYLALRQAITPDRLMGRMTATMRFLTVAAAPLGSLAGGALATAIGLRGWGATCRSTAPGPWLCRAGSSSCPG